MTPRAPSNTNNGGCKLGRFNGATCIEMGAGLISPKLVWWFCNVLLYSIYIYIYLYTVYMWLIHIYLYIYIFMYTHDICAHICTVYVYTSAVQWCLTSTNSTFQLDAFVKNEPMNQLHRKKMSQNLLLFMFCWFCRVPMFMPCFFSFLEPWSTRCSHDFARICFYGAHGRWQTTLSRHFGLDGHWRFLLFVWLTKTIVEDEDIGCLKKFTWNTLRCLFGFVWLRIQEWRRITWFVFVWLIACGLSFHSLRSYVILCPFPNWFSKAKRGAIQVLAECLWGFDAVWMSGCMSSENNCCSIKGFPNWRVASDILDIHIYIFF